MRRESNGEKSFEKPCRYIFKTGNLKKSRKHPNYTNPKFN